MNAGADAIGLVFYRASPRYVSVAAAQAIVAALPPFVTAVGLFVDAGAHEIKETLGAVPLGLLQFHGAEDAAFAQQFGLPYLKAIRMRGGVDVLATVGQHSRAAGFLLDAFDANKAGGTGHTFDWQRIPAAVPNLVLAGGLNAHNVAAAIQQCKPYAVDVSSAVESTPGLKDATKIQQFIAACGNAEVGGVQAQ